MSCNTSRLSGISLDLIEDALLDPELDRAVDSLGSRQRRLILLLLRDGTVKTESDVIMRGRSDSEDVEFELRHNHLPKLEEAGYIEWDREAGEISEGPRFEEIKPILELIENHADELPPGWP